MQNMTDALSKFRKFESTNVTSPSKEAPPEKAVANEDSGSFVKSLLQGAKNVIAFAGEQIGRGLKAAWKSITTESALKSEGQSSKKKENDLWFLGVDLTNKSDKQDKNPEIKAKENEFEVLFNKTPPAITHSAKLATQYANKERKAETRPSVETPKTDASEKKSTPKNK